MADKKSDATSCGSYPAPGCSPLYYEVSSDGKGLLKYLRNPEQGNDPSTGYGPIFYHVHSIEMTEVERWIYGMLTTRAAEIEKAIERGYNLGRRAEEHRWISAGAKFPAEAVNGSTANPKLTLDVPSANVRSEERP